MLGINSICHSKKSVSGKTIHAWDGTNVAADLVDKKLTTYVWGYGLVVSETTGAFEVYYQKNAHGDVVRLADTAGKEQRRYSYDAFGNERNQDSKDNNPFRYCGEYYDKETGSLYLRARYYNPATGRFLTEDTHWNPQNMIYGDSPVKLANKSYAPHILSIMQGNNLYGYCMNNPQMFFDGSGEYAEWPPGKVHNWVLNDIVRKNTGVSSERWLIYNPAFAPETSVLGRADLVINNTGEMFELKPATTAKKIAMTQLNNYASNSYFLGPRLKDVVKPIVFNGDPESIGLNLGTAVDPISLYHRTASSSYRIKYWYAGDGVLHYNYEKTKRYEFSDVISSAADQFIYWLIIPFMPGIGGNRERSPGFGSGYGPRIGVGG